MAYAKIPESILEECLASLGPTSNFAKVLNAGKEVRAHGLTPIYLYDDVLGILEVVTQEMLDNKLN